MQSIFFLQSGSLLVGLMSEHKFSVSLLMLLNLSGQHNTSLLLVENVPATQKPFLRFPNELLNSVLFFSKFHLGLGRYELDFSIYFNNVSLRYGYYSENIYASRSMENMFIGLISSIPMH